MGSLITLAIYAAMAAAALWAVHSFLNGYEEKGAARQLAADKPIIEACKVDRDTAIKANVSLKADVDKIAKERDQQSAAVDAAAKEAARLSALKDKALADARTRLAAYESDNASLSSILANAQPKGKTCEQTLAAVDDNLRTLARQRVRFQPAETGSNSGSANNSADKSPGSDSLRIH
jgi:hypothetical protein